MLTGPKSNSRHLSIRLTDYSTWPLDGATAISESVVADEHCGARLFQTGLMRLRQTDRSTALIEGATRTKKRP